MKIRKHKVKEYWFYPPDGSKLEKGSCYIFKYKRDLMKLLRGYPDDSANGIVRIHISSFAGGYVSKSYQVWYNQYKYIKGANFKIELKLLDSRKPSKYFMSMSNSDKRWRAFTDKICIKMCRFQEDDVELAKRQAKNIVDLYYRRGFVDEPDDENEEYIKYYIENGIDFYHWSDRCNWLRTKTIIRYFKTKGYIT